MNAPGPLAVESELGRRRWRVFSVTAVGMFMGTLDATIVAVALPVLSPALKMSYSEALWVQAVYLLTMCVFLIPVGRVADKRGLLRFFLAGVVMFGVFSLACSFATTGAFLIIARCFQGAGAAFMSATSPALVTSVFPPQERGRGLGLNTMAGYLGLMAGPPIGGLIVSHTSWHWIFLINVPIAVIVFTNGWFLLASEWRDREGARQRAAAPQTAGGDLAAPKASGRPVSGRPAGPAAGRLDWPGTALLALTLICLLVPLIFIPFWGWTSGRTIGLLVAFLVFLAAFTFVENRVEDPLLELDLVRRNRVFAAGNFAALLNYAAAYGITTLTAVFLEVVAGFSAQHAGLVLLTQPVFMTGLSAVFGRLSDRIGSRMLATCGMLLVAAGTAQLGTLPSSPPTWRLIVALGTAGVGMAAFSSPNTSSIMGSVRRDQLSLASGFVGTMRTAGQGISVALLGAIAASGLGPTGGRVLFLGEKASRAAAATFSDGYRTAMFVAAGIAAVGAIVSLVRGPRPNQDAAPGDGPPPPTH